MAESVDPAVAEFLIASGIGDRDHRRWAASLLLRGMRTPAKW
jgi:hypothetical protein